MFIVIMFTIIMFTVREGEGVRQKYVYGWEVPLPPTLRNQLKIRWRSSQQLSPHILIHSKNIYDLIGGIILGVERDVMPGAQIISTLESKTKN